jgi:hypothetical protein
MSENHVTSLNNLLVKKEEALKIVKENKIKHDNILKDAIEGYWLEADKNLKQLKVDRLKELKKQYQKNVKDFKKQIASDLNLIAKRKKDGPFNHLRQRYPEDHTDDYIGVIRRLELAVGENIQLNSSEFDQYVRNKWSWRESFLSTNSYYTAISGACSPIMSNAIGWTGTGSWYAVTASYSISASYSGGSVGVGTKNPTYKLNVKSSSEELDF